MPIELHHEINNMTFSAPDEYGVLLVDEFRANCRSSLKQSVVDDISILRKNPYIQQELAKNASGFIYDLKSGKLEAVKV